MESREEENNHLQFEIDKLVHEPARLKILAQLYVIESADFLFVMTQTGLTQGNVSAHLIKLEEAGYVQVRKTFSGKKPLTMISISEKGREAFRSYVERMQKVFENIN